MLHRAVVLSGTGYFSLYASPAEAAPKVIASLDYLVDTRALLDLDVRVMRCNIENANSSFLLCYAFPSGNTRNRVGAITIDGESLNREDLRKALSTCAEGNVNPNCWVNVIGTPYLRYPADKAPAIKDASLEWVKP